MFGVRAVGDGQMNGMVTDISYFQNDLARQLPFDTEIPADVIRVADIRIEEGNGLAQERPRSERRILRKDSGGEWIGKRVRRTQEVIVRRDELRGLAVTFLRKTYRGAGAAVIENLNGRHEDAETAADYRSRSKARRRPSHADTRAEDAGFGVVHVRIVRAGKIEGAQRAELAGRQVASLRSSNRRRWHRPPHTPLVPPPKWGSPR